MFFESCLHKEQDIKDMAIFRSVDGGQSITGAWAFWIDLEREGNMREGPYLQEANLGANENKPSL
jgi:hypothetical protein